MITKCPNCQTVFNVRKEQLAAAKGLVRCGSCMTVFNAAAESPSAQAQHQPDASNTSAKKPLNPPPKPRPQAKPSKSGGTRSAPSQVKRTTRASTAPPLRRATSKGDSALSNQEEPTKRYTDDGVVMQDGNPATHRSRTQTDQERDNDWSDKMHANLKSIDEDLEKLEQNVKPFKPQKRMGIEAQIDAVTAHAERAFNAASNITISDSKDDLIDDDIEDGITGLISDDMNEDLIQDSADEIDDIDKDLSDTFLDIADSTNHQDHFSSETGNNLPSKQQDESWAESLLEELDDNHSMLDAFSANEADIIDSSLDNENQKKPKPDQNVIFDTSRLDQDIADFFVSSDEISYDSPTTIKVPKKPKKNDQKSLHQLNDDPLDSINQSGGTGRKLLNAILFLALLLAFGAQYIYYNFNVLAKNKHWRPQLTLLCQMIGCELQPLRDPNQLKTVSVALREHPSEAGLLSVDAIIYSLAELPVPFPNLILRFTNSNGESAKEFVIKPSDYRKGDLLQFDTMPPEKSIQIKFDVEDPGLTNYSLRFDYP